MYSPPSTIIRPSGRIAEPKYSGVYPAGIDAIWLHVPSA